MTIETCAADECDWDDVVEAVPMFVYHPQSEVGEWLRTHPITPGMVIPVDDPLTCCERRRL